MAKQTHTKKELEKLSRKLSYSPELVWDKISDAEKKKVFKYGEEYKRFLDQAKTEREAVSVIKKKAKNRGFLEKPKAGSLSPMIRVFHDKSIALALPGTASLKSGVRLVVSHIDAPRLDLKQRPLYEDLDMVFLKTHYYGGIKKFQWLARPLAIHGRIIKTDGMTVDVIIGEDDNDPSFTILDILPHLARKVQYTKKINTAIAGEKLNLVVGSLPIGVKGVKDRFKLAILDYLYKAYNIVEEDFLSAEIEVVPSGRARDVGWDRALIGSYGQDDRVCAFASLKAVMDIGPVKKSAVILFADKEEIGSEGATSAKSKFLESVICDLIDNVGGSASMREVYRILSCSRALSADVTSGMNPEYPEVYEKNNTARIGYGTCMTKFTGHGGKYNANDADAEYVGWLRRLLNQKKVIWQTGELGKVDEGGGGTVAKFLASYGMDIIDFGPPVLAMHSPFEVTHKSDIFMTYKGIRSFLEAP